MVEIKVYPESTKRKPSVEVGNLYYEDKMGRLGKGFTEPYQKGDRPRNETSFQRGRVNTPGRCGWKKPPARKVGAR